MSMDKDYFGNTLLRGKRRFHRIDAVPALGRRVLVTLANDPNATEHAGMTIPPPDFFVPRGIGQEVAYQLADGSTLNAGLVHFWRYV